MLGRPANDPAMMEPSVKNEEDTVTKGQSVDETPEWSDSDSEPLIKLKDTSVVEMARLLSPKLSEQLTPRSPAAIVFDNQGDSSSPLSPNRVQTGRSQDMPTKRSIFDVSPDLPGFVMRPAGAAPKLTEITPKTMSVFDSFNDLFFGAPIAFTQCTTIPGSDAPMTLPV